MRKLFVLVFCLSFAALAMVGIPASASAQGRGLQPEDLHRLRSVGQARISADGRKILYSVQSREGDRGISSKIWVWDVESGRSSPLLRGKGRGSNARWSPDGQKIAYMGSEGGRRGLMVVRSDGSDQKYLAPVEGTNHPLPSSGERFTWSPDGKSIAFVSTTPGPETGDASGDPVVITRYLYKPTAREGLTRFNDNKRLHIFVVNVDGSGLRQLTDGTYYEHSLDWSPSGEEILFVSNQEPDPDRFFNYDLFAIMVSDGSIRRLTATENIEYQPIWSPDGKTIAYLGTRRGLTSSETTMEDTHVWLMDADGSNRRELGAPVDNRQRSHGWSPDGSAVYCTVQERGNQKLYRLPVSGGKPELLAIPSSTGSVVTEMGVRVASWSISKGRYVCCRHGCSPIQVDRSRTSRSSRRKLWRAARYVDHHPDPSFQSCDFYVRHLQLVELQLHGLLP